MDGPPEEKERHDPTNSLAEAMIAGFCALQAKRTLPSQVEGEVPGLLGDPGGVGMPRRSGHVDPPHWTSITKNT